MPELRQLNIRLSEETHQILEAAAFVRELRSAQPLIEPLIEKLAAELIEDEAVASAVKARRSYTEREYAAKRARKKAEESHLRPVE